MPINTTVESLFFWNGYNERTLRTRLSYCSKGRQWKVYSFLFEFLT